MVASGLERAELWRLYANRFDGEEARRDALWRVLCADFFQRWIRPDAAVLELGAGSCEFINNIRAGSKTAVDLNASSLVRAAADVRTLCVRSSELAPVGTASVDVVFVSNFFEHITKQELLLTLAEVRRVLRPGGRLLVLQPNIRYCGPEYWMFFDHITPLDQHSLREALELSGFRVERLIARFLPFTTKGRLPASALLARIYLRLPLAWRLFGQQTFVVAQPAAAGRPAPV